MTNATGSPYPSEPQELLLKAALLDRDEALPAWETWRAGWVVDDHLDHGSFRLLPLLYRNLSGLGVSDPVMMKLKGIYRHAWYQNVKLFAESRQVLDLFSRKGIPTLMLKGAALSVICYRDHGSRPMSDIDLLIPAERAQEGILALKEAGWKAEHEAYLEYNLRYGRSMMFYNSNGVEIDLHWQPLFESLGHACGSDLWDHAVPFEFMGIQTLALCPADNLLHLIVHGTQWNPEPPVRWIADAMTVLKSSGPPPDWGRLLAQAKKYKVALQVAKAFRYLERHFHAPVPENFLAELEMARITLAERLLYHHDRKMHDPDPGGFFRKIYLLFMIYLRQSEKKGFFRQAAGFLRYLGFRTKGKDRLRILRYYIARNPGRSRRLQMNARK